MELFAGIVRDLQAIDALSLAEKERDGLIRARVALVIGGDGDGGGPPEPRLIRELGFALAREATSPGGHIRMPAVSSSTT